MKNIIHQKNLTKSNLGQPQKDAHIDSSYSNCQMMENFESNEEIIHHIQGTFNQINNLFLIRKHRDQRHWDDILKVI